MTTIRVTPMEPEHFGIEVDEGSGTSGHRLHLREPLIAEVGLEEADRVRLAHETIAFLLDRTEATSLPAEIDADDLDRRFDDFRGELARRVGPTS